MAEVTNDLLYNTLKQLQGQLCSIRLKVTEINSELQAHCTHTLAMRYDLKNIHAILVRHDAQLERIERRLEIAEVTG